MRRCFFELCVDVAYQDHLRIIVEKRRTQHQKVGRSGDCARNTVCPKKQQHQQKKAVYMPRCRIVRTYNCCHVIVYNATGRSVFVCASNGVCSIECVLSQVPTTRVFAIFAQSTQNRRRRIDARFISVPPKCLASNLSLPSHPCHSLTSYQNRRSYARAFA